MSQDQDPWVSRPCDVSHKAEFVLMLIKGLFGTRLCAFLALVTDVLSCPSHAPERLARETCLSKPVCLILHETISSDSSSVFSTVVLRIEDWI